MSVKRTVIMISTTLWSVLSAHPAAATPEPHGGFVTAEGSKLKLNGGDFYFSGVNSYSILYSEEEAREQFEILSDMGANVLRFWGFWNGEDLNPQLDEEGNVIREGTPDTDIYGRYVLQSRPGVYPEPAWRRMDYAIYLAHEYGIKLIIPLMNQWPEFGGLDTYLRWVGVDVEAPPASEGHYLRENTIKEYRDLFWDSVNDDGYPNSEPYPDASEKVKQIYLDYVTHMLNRVNVYTGIAYKDDPAIMIWELFNEPRFGPWGGDSSGDRVRSFLIEAAAHVKSIDKNHLVSTGEEGFMRAGDNSLGRDTYPWTAGSGEGIDFLETAQLEDIDILSIHSWPFQWNLWGISEQDLGHDTQGEYPEPEDMAVFEKEWIEEHVRIAESVNKPIYLGEFGYQILRAGESTLALRNLIFASVYDTCKAVNITGATVFNILASHDVESAVYTGPMERNTIVMGQINDDLKPHDLDYKFDVYCPEDETTCDLVKDFSDFQSKRIENPDPRFEGYCVSPETLCGGECVFLDTHPDHCGDCGHVCGSDETCVDGECVESAPQSTNRGTTSGDDGCATVCPARSSYGVVALISRLLRQTTRRARDTEAAVRGDK